MALVISNFVPKFQTNHNERIAKGAIQELRNTVGVGVKFPGKTHYKDVRFVISVTRG